MRAPDLEFEGNGRVTQEMRTASRCYKPSWQTRHFGNWCIPYMTRIFSDAGKYF